MGPRCRVQSLEMREFKLTITEHFTVKERGDNQSKGCPKFAPSVSLAGIKRSQDILLMVRSICSPRTLGQHIAPVPLSKGTLRAILEEWGLPSLFLRAIYRMIPIATAYRSHRIHSSHGLKAFLFLLFGS
jgi:hypothetical protein